ncbi:hypothetical protein VOLCADRAFT_82924 [Volvox carteri f. nagariensis]|uniref:Uncharacterized protein n=1 Tax=Volvox carteri f. nagariensis TaxID=3068 RepID=D8U7S0_VOLCA|nr:uncharacterized protein VOLCADRAFT_82924 [Volvox carteri f. nagariensis]EFJ44282.1 hypothetical protein VOLCADRAFT_82924 [Volvox carteri f. nagariensis]|eukprot:XP_002954641.1 hypothetical protein VOLCADRAFT_82924 [Volvox carteri f. nagariensis]
MLLKSSCRLTLPPRICGRVALMPGALGRGCRRQLCRANPEELTPVPIIREEGQVPSLLRSSPDEFGEEDEGSGALQKFLYPDPEELPPQESLSMPIWDHLDELRERVLVAALACAVAILACFAFSKDLVVFLEAPVADAGVRFLQLSPGEFFFTTLKASGYAGLLLAAPTVLYEVIAYVVPGLTKSERTFLAPIVFGSSILFYLGLAFSYEILTPAALNFFVSYADGAVESLWSIDQYFEFVLVLMLSTGLSFQVPVLQVMLGQLGIVTSEQMFSIWRWVVVGSTIAAAVLTPSTDPFTQAGFLSRALLAIPLVGLYMGGASVVRVIEQSRGQTAKAV